MPDTSRASHQPESDQRPTLVLLVYTWDMVSAIVAIFEALAPFAGGVAIGAGQEEIPVWLQLVAALSAATYAAVLIILASLLTRRNRWIQRTQILALALAIGLSAISLAVGYVRGTVDIVPILTSALIVLFDLLAIVLMTERRVTAWYTEPGRPPRYVLGTLGFWVASYAALIVIAAIR